MLKFWTIFSATILLSGCVNKTPAVSAAIKSQQQDYEQGYQNLSDQYDALKTSDLAVFQKKIDLELQSDLNSLSIETHLNPAKWAAPADIAAETVRLQGLHDTKLATFKASIAQFDTLKAKNESVNIANARAINNALNPPPVPTTTANLAPQIQAASGTTAPAPLSAATQATGK